MPGIYIHIPFCRKACSYCDFYFTISYKKKKEMIEAICKDLATKAMFDKFETETIYFGGGTPSTLNLKEVEQILQQVYKNYRVVNNPEITFEANPDDLNFSYLSGLKNIGINRISLGVQSFNDQFLKLINRRHNSFQAIEALKNVKQVFNNVSADLIFGIPGITENDLKYSVEVFTDLQITHASCYALTYEQKTPLYYNLQKNKFIQTSDEEYEKQFYFLRETFLKYNYEHYEISNYALPGFQSKHNSAYWSHNDYIGVGPSAHSYYRDKRYWNISGIKSYISKINAGEKYYDYEIINAPKKYNEIVMLNLRTRKGVDIKNIERLGEEYKIHFLETSKKYLKDKILNKEENNYKLNYQYWFIADKIISDLIYVEDN